MIVIPLRFLLEWSKLAAYPRLLSIEQLFVQLLDRTWFQQWTVDPKSCHFDHYHYEFTSFSQFWVQGRQLQGSPSETLQNDKTYENIKDNKRTYKMIKK